MLKYLKTTVCAVAGLALGATAAIANPYEEFAGETLVVNFPAHPHFDAVMKVLPEFTKETGIRVEVDQLQYLKMRERQTLELTKNRGDYDLIAYVVFSKADYVYADQLENLARFFMNPKLADPNYDAEDLIGAHTRTLKSGRHDPRFYAELWETIKAGRVWVNCYHAYPAHAAFGGYKKSGIGREGHKVALEHYQQTKNMLVSHDISPLGFF